MVEKALPKEVLRMNHIILQRGRRKLILLRKRSRRLRSCQVVG